MPSEVVPFDTETVELMRSLAAQAAVAVENNLLYKSIERLFEGFVTAAVTAIEQRDPTTSGHSFRVADLTVELARVVDRDDEKYRDVRFTSEQVREIRYASLLHDFGKVGVREQVLVKEKKLYPLQLETLRNRFEFAMKVGRERRQPPQARIPPRARPRGVQGSWSRRSMPSCASSWRRCRRTSPSSRNRTSRPSCRKGSFSTSSNWPSRSSATSAASAAGCSNPEEVRILSIRKGNLDAAERSEIESHVTHTFNFLQKIPWTKDLAAVADIAYAHHEKLNGRGYPRKLTADEIPIQSRMMTVSDIYDALTANDRPYKRAISTERALDILKMEVGDGLLDAEPGQHLHRREGVRAGGRAADVDFTRSRGVAENAFLRVLRASA